MTKTFVRGNDKLNQALADPQTATAVKSIRQAMARADEEYALHLAEIRRAANLTQAEIARRMGVNQPTVSGIESREDILLSTLANYLRAAGVQDAQLTITVGGRALSYDLA
jgi:DNA-binding XRE family transcriptional regulator